MTLRFIQKNFQNLQFESSALTYTVLNERHNSFASDIRAGPRGHVSV
jgi:hypothetical protein